MRCWDRLGGNVEATSWGELVLFICAVSHFKSKLNARGGWTVGAKVKLCIKKCGLDVRRPFGTGNRSSDPCQFFTPNAPPKTPPPSDRRQNEEFLDSIHVSSTTYSQWTPHFLFLSSLAWISAKEPQNLKMASRENNYLI
jgi:hypothetical protein